MRLDRHPIYQAIYDLVQKIEELPASPLQTEIVCMAGELEKPADSLVETVERLPCTADGVRVVPGMRAYGAFRDGIEGGYLTGGVSASGNRLMFVPDECDPDDPHVIVIADRFCLLAAQSAIYSTRAAAEAAST